MRPPYRDRVEAGEVLAIEVEKTVRPPVVVAAIPRGGVIVAAPIAHRLNAPLTLSHVRKISFETAPELAAGALDEDGRVLMNEDVVALMRATAKDVARARKRALEDIERQRRRYPAPCLGPLARDATVVLVDDGLATGLTMEGGIAYARRHGAARVVVAVPCSSTGAAERLGRVADSFLCPWVDPRFWAVGAHYYDFSPVSDDEVIAALASGSVSQEA